jgi:hypothetical protein
VEKAVDYIISCANFDGGYGVAPGAESHSGQIFACCAALAIAGRVDTVDKDKLGMWLSERQVEGGGLNGRPEKLEDVCYSWWVASSLSMIGRLHWIDGKRLSRFILNCQVRGRTTRDGVWLTSDRIPKMEASLIGRVIWLMSSIRTLGLRVFRCWNLMGWRKSMLHSEGPFPLFPLYVLTILQLHAEEGNRESARTRTLQ